MKTVNVVLNTFDDEGNVVDTDNMDLTNSQVSDIIDHAAQLIIMQRDRDSVGIGSAMLELEAALENAGVIAETVVW